MQSIWWALWPLIRTANSSGQRNDSIKVQSNERRRQLRCPATTSRLFLPKIEFMRLRLQHRRTRPTRAQWITMRIRQHRANSTRSTRSVRWRQSNVSAKPAPICMQMRWIVRRRRARWRARPSIRNRSPKKSFSKKWNWIMANGRQSVRIHRKAPDTRSNAHHSDSIRTLGHRSIIIIPIRNTITWTKHSTIRSTVHAPQKRFDPNTMTTHGTFWRAAVPMNTTMWCWRRRIRPYPIDDSTKSIMRRPCRVAGRA